MSSERKTSYAKTLAYHLNSRNEFYNNAHFLNLNDDNRHYNYVVLPGYTEENGYTNSYGYEVLTQLEQSFNNTVNSHIELNKNAEKFDIDALKTDLLNVMNESGAQVSNSELRFYMNELVWFATEHTMKEKSNSHLAIK